MAGVVEYTDCISAEDYDPPRNECTGHDIELSDGNTPALELWEMWSTSSLPSFPGLPWLGMVAPTNDSNRTVWHLNCMQTNNMLNRIVRNRTVWPFNCV